MHTWNHGAGTLLAMALLVPVTFGSQPARSEPLANTTTPAISAPGKFILAYTDGQDPQSYTNLQSFHGSLSAVALGSAYGILADGTLDLSGVTTTTTNIIAYGKSQGLPVYASVSDYSNSIGGFDPDIMQTIDSSATTRNSAIANLVDLAVSNGLAGINLDVEAVGMEANGPTAADTRNFTAFVTALATALHAQGLKLIESVPASDGTANYAYVGGYDYAALGAVVDYIQVMTYDEVGPGWSSSSSGTWPGPCSGLDWMQGILTYAVSQAPAARILLGLPTYGYDFSTGGQQTWAADKTYGTQGFSAYIASKSAKSFVDAGSATPYATWGKVKQQSGAFSKKTAQPVLWFDNPTSITTKTRLIGQYALGGAGVWAMGYEDVSFWNALAAGL
jgi:spore germination protein YaaH